MVYATLQCKIVIPAEMRENIEEGEKLVILRNNHQLIIEKVKELSESLKDDLAFAKKTEEAWKSYERGEFKSMDSKNFLKELKKW